MRKVLIMGLLLVAAAAVAENDPEAKKPTQPEPAYDISEFNRVYWSWRRCMYRWEKEHGSERADKQMEVCGKEPVLPK